MAKQAKRPKDANQLAKLIADIATGEKEDTPAPSQKNAAAVELGRLGGLKGGKARANKLSPEQRKEIAKKAAEKRWKAK
ncbi:MAG: histone H1 [Chitinophagaceae bacterium]|nr:histone H1 [Chitinophagaceae bacterium]